MVSLRSILYRRSILYSSQKDTNGVIFPTKKKLCYLNKYIRLWFLIHPIRLFYTKRLQETFPSIIFFFMRLRRTLFFFSISVRKFSTGWVFFFFFARRDYLYLVLWVCEKKEWQTFARTISFYVSEECI